MWYFTLVYKTTSKERRIEHPPTSSQPLFIFNLSATSNHSSCSDIPSKFLPTILHTTNTTLIATTMAHYLKLQHLTPLPYHIKLYHYHSIIFPHHCHIHSCLLLFITPISSGLFPDIYFHYLLLVLWQLLFQSIVHFYFHLQWILC